ncbi:MAG: hypothetical protein KAJ73_05490 [Zetaproteobacteria bacterium]|nr:hypothetical protein [Zetaproteobacteria bacterium]
MKITPTEGYRVAFPTDEHHPYSDELARSVALQIVQDFKPHLLTSGSDAIDFYTISKFEKDPYRGKTIQAEINAFQVAQREWNSAAPEARKVFIAGNHEDRLRRWVWRHSDMAGLDALLLQNLLGLDALGVEYEEEMFSESYGKSEIDLGRLLIKHGTLVRKHSAYTARGELEKEFYDVPVLFTGHTHRGGDHFATLRRGVHRAVECFCLCNMDPAYVDRPNWQQGLVIATIYGTLVQVEPIPISETANGSRVAIWRDKLYNSE